MSITFGQILVIILIYLLLFGDLVSIVDKVEEFLQKLSKKISKITKK